jgi:hypothetical protein
MALFNSKEDQCSLCEGQSSSISGHMMVLILTWIGLPGKLATSDQKS